MNHQLFAQGKRRAHAVALAASVLLTSAQALTTVPIAAQGADINYASALQMSIYFYECQQAGELPDWNRVEWRGDATVGDPIPGGWYDAGDHVKFNLPMSYSATMLSWGLYLYEDGVKACGEYTNYVNNLKWVLDYLARCDLGNEAVYQVGDGTDDHSWWGPVELLEYGMADQGITGPRTTIAGRDASAVTAEMGAALAAGYCALKDSGMVSATELEGYLTHAKNFFDMANEDRSDDAYNKSDAQGFYQSRQFFDDLFFCANWLYMATGDKAYLEDAKELTAGLGKELGSSDLKYSWANCWDDVQQGATLLYAINTGDATWKAQAKKHLDYWLNTSSVLDGGLVYVDSWGCLRYACGVGFVVAAACDTLFQDDSKAAEYKKLYESQINYCLGANPEKRCYVIGYDETSPAHPHHRTAHGSWKNDLQIPEPSRHQLFGALVGGPDSTGVYTDDRGLFVYTEVATDYNAAYTALLCKMVSAYGGKTDPNFPAPDTRDDEFYVAAKVTNSSSGSTVSMKLTNHTAWPARVVDNISMRYYMDLTEVIDAGFSASDVALRCDRDQSAMYSGKGYKTANISELKQYKGNIYYVEITFPDGRVALPISEGQHQCEILLALVFPNYGDGWDATNDYSAQKLTSTENAQTPYIPVYENGTLIYGIEPDGTTGTGSISARQYGGSAPVVSGTTTSATTTTTTSTPTETVSYGDVDCSGSVDIGDVILLNRYVAEDKTISVTKQGLKNADCSYDSVINAVDASQIMRYLAKIIPITALGPQAKRLRNAGVSGCAAIVERKCQTMQPSLSARKLLTKGLTGAFLLTALVNPFPQGVLPCSSATAAVAAEQPESDASTAMQVPVAEPVVTTAPVADALASSTSTGTRADVQRLPSVQGTSELSAGMEIAMHTGDAPKTFTLPNADKWYISDVDYDEGVFVSYTESELTIALTETAYHWNVDHAEVTVLLTMKEDTSSNAQMPIYVDLADVYSTSMYSTTTTSSTSTSTIEITTVTTFRDPTWRFSNSYACVVGQTFWIYSQELDPSYSLDRATCTVSDASVLEIVRDTRFGGETLAIHGLSAGQTTVTVQYCGRVIDTFSFTVYENQLPKQPVALNVGESVRIPSLPNISNVSMDKKAACCTEDASGYVVSGESFGIARLQFAVANVVQTYSYTPHMEDWDYYGVTFCVSDPSFMPHTVGEVWSNDQYWDATIADPSIAKPCDGSGLMAISVGKTPVIIGNETEIATQTVSVVAPSALKLSQNTVSLAFFDKNHPDNGQAFLQLTCETKWESYLGQDTFSDGTAYPTEWRDDVTWTSAAPSVVTVDTMGRLSPQGLGETTVTATAFGQTFRILVTVDPCNAISQQTLSFDRIGATTQLAVTNATDILWTSSAPTVATVDSKGVVTAVANGVAIIYAIVGDRTFQCAVTVQADPYLNYLKATICVGGSVSLAVCNAAELVTWAVKDETIATVKDGYVKGLSGGTTVVYAITPSQTYACALTVDGVPMKHPGDINDDHQVDIGDAILLSRLIAEDPTAGASKTGLRNADCVYDGTLTADDITRLLQVLAKILPETVLGQPAFPA